MKQAEAERGLLLHTGDEVQGLTPQANPDRKGQPDYTRGVRLAE